MKKVFISNNQDNISINTKKELTDLLIKNNYKISYKNPDIAISIGGDGSFLRMIKQLNYNTLPIYVGINCGTLGFLQDIKSDDLDKFIYNLNNKKYKIEEINLEDILINTNDNQYEFSAVNEIVIREEELNTCHLDIIIDGSMLEKYSGDGIIISPPVESTAYNLSYGGSIVYNSLDVLQITKIAPLHNRVHKTLLNPIVIPNNLDILIKPKTENLLISIDGVNTKIKNIKSIEIKCLKKIKCLRENEYHFIKKINDKIIS